MTKKELIEIAKEARKMAYVPYSNFSVGAALLTKSGKVYTGCNIENSSYPLTMCAERTAIFKAVSEGERDFEMIAEVGGPMTEPDATSRYISPCGACRQTLAEYNDGSMTIICAKSADDYVEMTLAEMLPMMFTPESL